MSLVLMCYIAFLGLFIVHFPGGDTAYLFESSIPALPTTMSSVPKGYVPFRTFLLVFYSVFIQRSSWWGFSKGDAFGAPPWRAALVLLRITRPAVAAPHHPGEL